MAKKYDVVATTGFYMAGNEKKYVSRNVGSVIETQHGLAITLDASFNPAGCPISEDGKVWLKLFEPRPKDQNQAHQQNSSQQQNSRPAQQPQGGFGDFDQDSDIPFMRLHYLA